MTHQESDLTRMPRSVIAMPSASFYAPPVPAPPAANAGNTVVIETAWNVVRRWWKIACPVGCLLAAAGISFVVYTFTPSYQAKSWIRIESQNSLFPESRFSVANTQLQLIRTPMVLEDAARDVKVARVASVRNSLDPTSWLASRVSVGAVGNSNVFNILFTADDPDTAADIANAITNAYFKLYQQESEGREKKILEALEEEREKAKRDVVLQRDKIRTKTGKDPELGIISDVAPEDALMVLQQQIIRRHVSLELARAELKVVECMDAQSEIRVPQALLEDELSHHPLYEKLNRDRARMEQTKLASARGEKDPAYVKLAEQVRRDQAVLDEFKAKLPDELKQSVVANNKLTIDELRTKLADEQVALDMLKQQYQGKMKEILADNADRIEVELQKAELRWQERTLSMVGDEIFKLRSNLRFAPGTMTVLRDATPPVRPVSDMPSKKMLMVGVAGFGFPFGLFFLWEMLFRRVTTAYEITRVFNLPVLGEIATLPPIGSSAHGRKQRDLSLFRESVDILSTSILLYEPLREMQVLAITSATTGEGKTSVSSQVAVSIARSSNQRTLLIDADMRRPDIHNIFEIRQQPGLAEVLDGRCSVEEAMVRNWVEELDVIPAGRLRCSPQKLVGSGQLMRLLAELRQRYRYIVIDTPPVLSVAETMVYARQADAVLMCTMRDISRMDQVRLACQRLEAAGRKPTGAVLCGVPTTSYRYYYGRYDYSYRPEIETGTSSAS